MGSSDKRKVYCPWRNGWFIRNPVKSVNNVSIIWKVVVVAFPSVGNWFVWSDGRGTKVKLGVDPWISCGNDYRLPNHITLYLRSRGYFILITGCQCEQNHHLVSTVKHGILGGIWVSWRKMQLWDLYVDKHRSSFVRLKNDKDQMVWSLNPTGIYTPKEGYKTLAGEGDLEPQKWWWKKGRRLKCPYKSRIFM